MCQNRMPVFSLVSLQVKPARGSFLSRTHRRTRTYAHSSGRAPEILEPLPASGDLVPDAEQCGAHLPDDHSDCGEVCPGEYDGAPCKPNFCLGKTRRYTKADGVDGFFRWTFKPGTFLFLFWLAAQNNLGLVVVALDFHSQSWTKGKMRVAAATGRRRRCTRAKSSTPWGRSPTSSRTRPAR